MQVSVRYLDFNWVKIAKQLVFWHYITLDEHPVQRYNNVIVQQPPLAWLIPRKWARFQL